MVGLFQRLRESLSDNSISVSDLCGTLKPQSDGRDSFFKDVIQNANRFLDTHKAQLDTWKAKAKILSGKLSYDGQSAQKLESKNSFVARKLARLAGNEIHQFFKILVNPNIAAREEVSDLFGGKTYYSDGNTSET
jgi:hypothetical protein